MKRLTLIAACIIFLVAFSFTGCTSNSVNPSSTTSSSTQTTTTTTTTTNPEGGYVTGIMPGSPNTTLVLIPEDNLGRFIFKIGDDTPNTQTDELGQFKFSNLEPGYYLLASAVGNGVFQVYTAPSVTKLVTASAGMGNFWVFQVKSLTTVDLGILTKDKRVSAFEKSMDVTISRDDSQGGSNFFIP
jgi:ABC-type Fe3+-hydroxamate transport system substrate-binding protein